MKHTPQKTAAHLVQALGEEGAPCHEACGLQLCHTTSELHEHRFTMKHTPQKPAAHLVQALREEGAPRHEAADWHHPQPQRFIGHQQRARVGRGDVQRHVALVDTRPQQHLRL